MRLRWLGAVALVAACQGSSESAPSPSAPNGATTPDGPPKWMNVSGDRLGALPPPGSASTPQFATSDACAQCHLAGDGVALRDAKGRDVSPVGTWKTSAMALAARDPYYLAAFADELAFRPNLADVVEATCTRCHSPAGAVELEAGGTTPTFAMLTTASDASKAAHLAREGVTCTLCHQIEPDGLGTDATFTGQFKVGDQRRIYGPYVDPLTDPMRTIVSYTPAHAPHVQKSALCATCHTVITRARDAKGYVGPAFPEQVPYLEWRASSFANEDAPGPKAAACQDCHMPAADDDGATLEVPIAKSPLGLKPRKPFWRHGFEGANIQLARFGAADPKWFGVPLAREDHERQAAADEKMLRSAAKVDAAATRNGAGVELRVTVTNTAGHKLPTGYPSRRLVVHVKVASASGDVVFESGRTDAFGRLVSRAGKVVEPATFFPHFDVVSREDDVQIYEAVPIDARGRPAHRPLDAVRYAKDNRLVPHGFDRKSAFSAYIAPIGVEQDPGFGDADVVTYRLGDVPAGATITVELLFQVARPSDIEAFAGAPTPAARRLFDFAIAAPPVPVTIAKTTITPP